MAECRGCFADCGFSCAALKFKPIGKCRFYKTQLRLDHERAEAEKRLKRIGKEYLIVGYLPDRKDRS